jgi:hypothetical protein
MLAPISFSIPEEKLCIIDNINYKTKILSSLIPGDTSTYIYNTEQDYYNEYKESYFAMTVKKAGWDCMRHYEILANGCVPYFVDIEECPQYTMYLCPKHLFIEANALYNKLKTKQIRDLTDEDINTYNKLRNRLFEYTQTYLTTSKMASYILRQTNFENVSKILYLSGSTFPDYLRCLTLHGFKKLFGANCHDYPKIPHIYKTNDIKYNELYGKGYTYTNLLDPMFRNDRLDSSIQEDIKNKYYEIIVYGSYHRGMPYYDLISTIYKPNEIILMCGEDIHYCNCSSLMQYGFNVFVREL